MGGIGPGELATVLGCSVNAATIRLHRARRRLAEIFDESPERTGRSRTSPYTLRNRQHAFDGTVAAVADDSVTLDVTEWFKGADRPAAITLQGASTLSAITPNGPATTLTPGTRLLVAGDAEFAWGCGFTQPYSEATAAAWRTALR